MKSLQISDTQNRHHMFTDMPASIFIRTDKL